MTREELAMMPNAELDKRLLAAEMLIASSGGKPLPENVAAERRELLEQKKRREEATLMALDLMERWSARGDVALSEMVGRVLAKQNWMRPRR